jgi:uncharacterized protein (DUF2461 family)
MSPQQLYAFRWAVAGDVGGDELERLVREAENKGLEVTAHDRLATAPRGYPKDHPRIDLLRLKGLITWQEWPVGRWLGTAKAKTKVVAFLRASQPVRDWLARYVDEPGTPAAPNLTHTSY